MDIQAIREFFRTNPRMWIGVVVAFGVGGLIAWSVFGLNFQIGKFFAATPPTAQLVASPSSVAPGGTVDLAWTSTDATSCTTVAGTFSTSGQPGGVATDRIDPATTATQVQFRIQCDGPGGSALSNVAKVTITAGGGATPTPGGSNACVLRTDANAPTPAWFCPGLGCKLDGNPGGLPPEGPAVRMNTKFFHATCEDAALAAKYGVSPSFPVVGCKAILDATPKCANGNECYPPKDPLWTCTGPFNLGRNGADKFDCYIPSGTVTGKDPITCCANTGLSGDCVTFQATEPAVTPPVSTLTPTPTPIGTTPTPIGATPTPIGATPTPIIPTTPPATPGPQVACAPQTQTINKGQTAVLTATSGDGKYQWNVTGGGVIEDGGNESIRISYTVPGTKTVRVSSSLTSASCTVTVLDTATTTPQSSAVLAIQKTARNSTQGQIALAETVSVNPGDQVQFAISVTSTTASVLNGVVVRDTLPTGMSYVPGSTTVQGQTIASETITSSGVAIGVLQPGENFVVRWSAVANRTSSLATGVTTSRPIASVLADGASPASDDVTLNIVGTGNGQATGTPGTGGVGTVETGPGDAVILALTVAAALTLLYTAYTRSPGFRRKEIEHITKEKDPMDFRT